MVGKSGDLKPFVDLSLSWVVMQGAAVVEMPIGEVARGRSFEACDGMVEMSTHY